jgi:hypothetical protein
VRRWLLFLVMCWAWGGVRAEVVENPAVPVQGVQDVPLREMWRTGGEDDELFFGNVLQVLPAPQGGVYILDSQLTQVFVLDAGGELLTVMGGRGEGPGEVSNVNSIVNLPGGGLGIGQVLPGVLACFDAAGEPTTRVRIQDREGPDSGLVLYLDARALGDDLLAIVMRWRLGDQGSMTQEMYLRSLDLQGRPLVDFHHKATLFDVADFHFTEAGYDFVWTRFGVLPDGNVCFAPERNRYEITICSADGALVRKVGRPYTSRRRTAEEKEEARLSHAAIASHYGREVRGVKAEDLDPDITALAVLDDGRLWVRTSRGDRQRDPGVLTTVDELDPAGRFTRQLRLLGPGDPDRDILHILPDGRVVVVTGAVQAYRREQNTERDSGQADEAPLEVICYAPQGNWR